MAKRLDEPTGRRLRVMKGPKGDPLEELAADPENPGLFYLVQINSTDEGWDDGIPLGILAVASALQQAGYRPEIRVIKETAIDALAQEVARVRPTFVGVSVITGIMTRHSVQFSKRVKELTDVPVVWGGIHPTMCPRQTLAEEFVDVIVLGEADISVLDLAQRMLAGRSLMGAPGIGHKEGGELHIEKRRPLIEELDRWRIDYRLLDVEKHLRPSGKFQRVAAYKASRGCAWHCAFCYNDRFNLGRWRAWSAEAIIEDVEYLKRVHEIDAIKFFDDDFFIDPDRAMKILEAIDLPYYAEIRVDEITEDVARRLKETQCVELLVGLECGSDRLLERIRKGFSLDQALEAVRILAKYELSPIYTAIVGLPTETPDEFDETIRLLRRVSKMHPQASFSLGAFLPYPGASLFALAKREGFTIPETTEQWGDLDRFRNRFTSPWTDVETVWRLRQYFLFIGGGYHIGPLKKWFEMRLDHELYRGDLDIHLVNQLALLAQRKHSPIGMAVRAAQRLIAGPRA